MNAADSPTSGLLGDAWRLYKSHWVHLLSVAFVVYAGVAVIGAVVTTAFEPQLAALVALAITFLGYFWVQGALVNAVEDIRDGRADLSFVETLSRGWERVGPIATASTLAVVAVTLGLFFFIIPGLILMTWWIVIVPVIVLEKAGARRSFGRSRSLVSGYEWSVLGVIVVTILILIGVSVVLEILLFPLTDWLQAFASDVVTGSLTAPFAALAWTLLYYRLREAHEPPSPPVA